MALPIYASPGDYVVHYGFRFFCGLVFLFLIAPILIIIPLSFNAEPYFTYTKAMLTLDPAAFSMRWYDRLLTFGMTNLDAPRDMAWWWDVWNNAQWVHAAKNSIIIGVASTLLATVLGTIAALGLSKKEMPFRRVIMALLISPMIVPLIITATGLFFFYSATGLAHTYIGIIMAHATLGIPFVIITVTATLVGFDHSLTRAAANLGATPSTIFFKVMLPLITPGVVSGALFAFVTSFDNYAVSMWLFDAGHVPLPMMMVSLISRMFDPGIAAIASLMIFFSLAIVLVLERLAGLRRAMSF